MVCFHTIWFNQINIKGNLFVFVLWKKVESINLLYFRKKIGRVVLYFTIECLWQFVIMRIKVTVLLVLKLIPFYRLCKITCKLNYISMWNKIIKWRQLSYFKNPSFKSIYSLYQKNTLKNMLEFLFSKMYIFFLWRSDNAIMTTLKSLFTFINMPQLTSY